MSQFEEISTIATRLAEVLRRVDGLRRVEPEPPDSFVNVENPAASFPLMYVMWEATTPTPTPGSLTLTHRFRLRLIDSQEQHADSMRQTYRAAVQQMMNVLRALSKAVALDGLIEAANPVRVEPLPADLIRLGYMGLDFSVDIINVFPVEYEV